MQLEKRSLYIKEIKLCYYKGGSGKPLLFLHGGRVRALTFKKNLELLGRHFSVIAPDLPGHGDSSIPPSAWTFKDYGEFFDTFLAKLKLKNVIVIGYSRGGGMALQLAQVNKDIANLILVDSDGVTNNKKGFFISDVKRAVFYIIRPRYFLILIGLLKDYAFFLSRYLFNPKKLIKMHRGPSFSKYSFVNKKIPTLILWAKNDWILPLENGVKLNKEIPGSQLEILEGNHDWILLDPQLFLKKITAVVR